MKPAGGFYVQITKDHWDTINRKIKARIPAGLELCGFGIERVAKQDARVDTGRYKSSIGHSQDLRSPKGIKKGTQINAADAVWRMTKGIVGVWLYIGTNVEYAPDLERRYGTLLKAMYKCKDLLTASLRETMRGTMTL